jgi:ubiquinone/menaquinone biosynthesis C-methylase UbiE
MLINIKKKLSIIYSLIKKLIYSGNIDKLKEDTWKSRKIAKKFYIKHIKKNYLFENSFSKIFTNKIKKNHTVLDVGCGTGRLTKELLKKTQKVYALDNSREMLNYAPKAAKLHLGSAFQLPFEKKKFDFVVSMDLILHFKNYMKIIDEMIRVTKKNGYIIFNIGNKEHLNFSKKVLKDNFFNIYDETGNSLSKPYYTVVSNKNIYKFAERRDVLVEEIVPYNFFQGNILLGSFSENDKEVNKFHDYIYKLYHNKYLKSFFQHYESKFVSNLDIKFTFYKIIILKKNNH